MPLQALAIIVIARLWLKAEEAKRYQVIGRQKSDHPCQMIYKAVESLAGKQDSMPRLLSWFSPAEAAIGQLPSVLACGTTTANFTLKILFWAFYADKLTR